MILSNRARDNPRQIGVVSHGEPNCGHRSPVVLTSVDAGRPWLIRQIALQG